MLNITNLFMNNGYDKYDKKIVTIGPYINYVKGLMGEKKQKKIIQNYGKILMVFQCIH